MSTSDRQQVNQISQQFEEVWAALDALFANMTTADWQQPHGPDWVFAELPYHLAYIDHDLVIHPVTAGADLPEAEQLSLGSLGALNKWNQEKLRERPDNLPISAAITQMEASRQKLRHLLAGMTDADLMRPAWFALLGDRGFRPAMGAILFGLIHTWGHYEEARIRRGIAESTMSPETLLAMIGLSIPVLAIFYDAQKAAELDFSFGFALSGRSSGSWLFQAKDGEWHITESALDKANLVLTCTVNGYVQMRYGMTGVPELMSGGNIKPSDMLGLATWGQLLAMPAEDYVFPAKP